MKITVRAQELKGLIKQLNSMSEKEKAAASRALNRAAKSTQTAIIRESSSEFGVTQKRLRRRIRYFQRDKATKQRLRSQVFLVISDVPVSWLGKPKQTPKGARVKGRTYDRSFVAKVGNHVGVFRRKMPGGGSMTSKQYQAIMMRGMTADSKHFRFPITEIKETVRLFLKRIGDEAVVRVGEPAFRKSLIHELRREFKL